MELLARLLPSMPGMPRLVPQASTMTHAMIRRLWLPSRVRLLRQARRRDSSQRDSLKHDILGATTFGIDSVLARTGVQAHVPEATLLAQMEEAQLAPGYLL